MSNETWNEGDGRQKPTLMERLHRAFGPLAGGILLDLVDLSTFGPYGLGGFVIGGLTGWWICSIYRIPTSARLVLALLAGVYCLLPLTEFVPLATLISAYVRFRGDRGAESRH